MALALELRPTTRAALLTAVEITPYRAFALDSSYKTLQVLYGSDSVDTRTLYNRHGLLIVAVQQGHLGSVAMNALLLQRDTTHGKLANKVRATATGINAGNGVMKVFSERDPENLPWDKLGIDVVLECTGIFTSKESAGAHIPAGAKKVLISAPSGDAPMYVMGVNQEKYTADQAVVSNASAPQVQIEAYLHCLPYV